MKAALLKSLFILGLTGQCVLSLATATGTKTEAVDCSQVPGTQSALNACAYQDFENATAAYSTAYKTLSQSVGNKQRQLLRQVQTEWIQYRVKACEFEKSGIEGGSAAPMINWQCQARMTRERTAELQRFLDCKEGDLSCVRQPR
ncbi:MAG: lysozyme inhibitor LprI family protein [Burkholderiales bacterium]|nr:lysozyme inhibitor LprI family protein [Burkholderiales bacterium]